MVISDDKTLKDIQREFNDKFPYLKIEFYKTHHEPGEGSPTQERLDSEMTIGEARQSHEEGDLRVQSNMKVSTLEQNFSEKYGLHVQVFRKSGNLWMQTTSTDEWTLNEQNRKGGSSERAYQEKYEPEQ